MGPEWMNWEGWCWISPLIAMASGIYFGWSVRSTIARSEKSQLAVAESLLVDLRVDLHEAELAMEPIARAPQPLCTITPGEPARVTPRMNDLCTVRWGHVVRVREALARINGGSDVGA